MSSKTNTAPFFSIIIPTLNEEVYLPKLLRDLGKQSNKDFELIIIDAKSEDKTRQKAYEFKNDFRKFTFIESEGKNVSFQKNLGADNAKADWIIFFDADNRLPENFIQKIKDYVLSNKPDLLSSFVSPESDGVMNKLTATFINTYSEIQRLFRQDFLLESFICIDKRIFQKLGGFNEHIHGEGGDLLRRAYEKKFKYHLLKHPKYSYSLRRGREEGLFRLFLSVFLIELLRFTNRKISEKAYRTIYPMKGGTYYKKRG